MRLGGEIKRLRGEAGMSQGQLGEALGGLSKSYVSQLERGQTGMSVETLCAVCAVFGVSCEHLLAFIPPPACRPGCKGKDKRK